MRNPLAERRRDDDLPDRDRLRQSGGEARPAARRRGAGRIAWLWPGYLAAGKLHVLDGDPGLGTSCLTLDLATRVSTGKRWPDDAQGCDPVGVLLLSAEDGLADTIRPRLDAASADVDRVYAFTVREVDPRTGARLERLATLPGETTRLARAITARDVGLWIR